MTEHFASYYLTAEASERRQRARVRRIAAESVIGPDERPTWPLTSDYWRLPTYEQKLVFLEAYGVATQC